MMRSTVIQKLTELAFIIKEIKTDLTKEDFEEIPERFDDAFERFKQVKKEMDSDTFNVDG